MFSAFWRYLRAFGYMFTGRFNKMSDALAENEHVMAATYDESINKSKSRYHTAKTALAELIGIEKELQIGITEHETKITNLTSLRSGAQIKMQNTIDAMRTAGKIREEIMVTKEFLSAKEAFDSAAMKLDAENAALDKKKNKLVERRASIAQRKVDLQKIERTAQDLEAEKQEALADVATAKQEQAANALNNPMSTDTTNADLERVRKARNRVVAMGEISSELAGTSVSSNDEELLTLAAQSNASKQLDGLLNWGDDNKKETLAPATLPEN